MNDSKRSNVQTRISRSDHKKLADLAKRLKTKPGPLGSWMLEVYADPAKPDSNKVSLHSLNIAAKFLGQLAQRLTAFDQFILREKEMAESDSNQKHDARRIHEQLTDILRLIWANANLCQGVATGLVTELPEELQPESQATQKISAAGPSATDSELQNLLAYLTVLRIFK